MRLSLLAILLVCACGTTVNNSMTFERDFMDSNPGPKSAAAADDFAEAVKAKLPPPAIMETLSPAEREKVIAAAEAEVKEDPTFSQPTGSEVAGNSGQGYQINIFVQTGAASQDVSAEVEAALRARGVVNSPNSSTGDGTEPE